MSTYYETDFDPWSYMETFRTNLTDGTEYKQIIDGLYGVFSEGTNQGTFSQSIIV